MFFVEMDDVIEMIDGLMVWLVKKLFGIELKFFLLRMIYDEVMWCFGYDVFDFWFGMEIVDCMEIVVMIEFCVFCGVVDVGNYVWVINVKGVVIDFLCKWIDEFIEYVK